MAQLPDPADTWTLDEARRILDEWKRTGGPLAAFARTHGYQARRLYWWKRQLADVARRVTLVPATIIEPATGDDLPAVTIRLPTGVEIEVGRASASWLAAVVTELARPS